jgi:tripartite-type tricarboxylate transporter receptor subunit TctC
MRRIVSGTSLAPESVRHAKLPYDPFRDFTPVIRLNRNAQARVATLSLPANNVKELIALAKARPGQLNIASPGRGSSNHVGMEMLKHVASIDIVHVAYKGAAPAVVYLLAGKVQLQLTSLPSVMSHIKAGRLKILGVGSPQRSTLLPEVPTIAESVVSGYDDTIWFGLFAPHGTPPRVIEVLDQQVAKALVGRELLQRLLAQGAEPIPSTPRELFDYMKPEHARWAEIIKVAAIRLD